MSATAAEPKAAIWPNELYDLLRRSGVTQFAYVPDAGHRVLIDRSLADPAAQAIALTTEEKRGWRCSPAPIWAARAACS
jgi:hypothetical protein